MYDTHEARRDIGPNVTPHFERSKSLFGERPYSVNPDIYLFIWHFSKAVPVSSIIGQYPASLVVFAD